MRNSLAQGAQIRSTVRAELARRNFTQGDLAAHLHLSQPAIARRMAGKVSWRVDELTKVANFLDLTMNDLVGDPVKASA